MSQAKTILFLQYFDPAGFPPLERAAWQFLERGWRVKFIGVAGQGDQQQLQLAPHPHLHSHLLKNGRGRIAACAYIATAARAIQRLRPDVIYCSQERVYPIGLAASFLPGVKTVLHEHDTPWICEATPNKLLPYIRTRFARRATLCVIPQEERAIKFKNGTGAGRVIVAFNTPSLRECRIAPKPQKGQGLVLWHHGSIGPGRLPPSVIQALARTPDDVELRIAGYETVNTRGYIERLRVLAADLGIGDRFKYLGALPERSDLYAAAQEADVGVLLFATMFAEPMAGASNKPFDFLACGLPLITNDTPEWGNFFGAQNVSRACRPDSPEDIARVIMWYREHPQERAAMAARGHELIRTRWNYERSFAPVLDVIDPIVASKKAF